MGSSSNFCVELDIISVIIHEAYLAYQTTYMLLALSDSTFSGSRARGLRMISMVDEEPVLVTIGVVCKVCFY